VFRFDKVDEVNGKPKLENELSVILEENVNHNK
jgi:hypothetical protein